MALTDNRKAFLSSLSLSALEIKILPLCAPYEDVISGYQTVTGISNFAERIYDNSDGADYWATLSVNVRSARCLPQQRKNTGRWTS